MHGTVLLVSVAALCLCACAPQPVRLQDGTTGYRIGCLSLRQCQQRAEKFCHGPYRTVDSLLGSGQVSATGTREQIVFDHITNTTRTIQVPVTDVDTISTGQTTVQCASAGP
jgi:hypothetical protein